MIEHLDKLGINNKVFVPTYSADISVITPNPNVVVSECFKKWDRIWFDYKQKKIIDEVEKAFNVTFFDCIHAYTLFTDGNCAMYLSQKYGIPYVVAVRNTDVNDFFRLMPHLRSRGIKIMKNASAVFFLSEAYRKHVFEHYVPKKYHKDIEKKTYIIPNGIDDFWFENSATTHSILEENDEIKLIYAGRIDKNKNIPTIQKAMKYLRERGYKVSLKVIGKVQDKKEFQRIVKNTYTSCVAMIPKEKLIEEYRAADIFVMPSFTESFGLVYAEAMSQGLPVIYSSGQGFDNQFEEGMVGFRVNAQDAQSVAEGIEKIINSYKSICNNVVFSARKFNWSDIVIEYCNIYKAVCEKGSSMGVYRTF